MANIVIDIAAEFTGKNAFKSAETSTDKLTKNIKGLAKTLGVTFGASQVLAYGKAAVKAAAADEKAQKQLALALKNVGLGRDVAASEAFIQKLQSEFGVVDDKLRPAYQQLAVATGDTAQSQKLLQIALDISASTGKDLGSVTGALSKAYLGNNTALGKLQVGISKADLKAKSFDEIMNDLSKTFKGAATQSANTFQGSMDRLAVASANAQEIIGKGIIDAIKILGEDTTVADLASGMEDFATYIAQSIVGLGLLINKIKEIPGSGLIGQPGMLGKLLKFGIDTSAIGYIAGLGKAEADKLAGYANADLGLLNRIAAAEAALAGKQTKTAKILTAEELKQLKAKQLKLAIDKANLALGKGSNIFDIEKIQLAAAEKSAAENLGKVTNSAQLLQITNDMARLQIKKDIIALEDAIASKDAAAITAATDKLNADLKIYGALTNQKIKLTEIEDILKAIVPKDLINLANLDAAIAKLKMIGGGTATSTSAVASTTTGTPSLLDALAAGSFVPVVGGGGYSSTAGNYASSGFPGSAMGGGGNTIIVNTGIGDPNAIAEAIDQVLTDAVSRGTLRVA
jgi:hypothetical protein